MERKMERKGAGISGMERSVWSDDSGVKKEIIRDFLKKSLIAPPEGGYGVIAISPEEEKWLEEE